MIKKFKCSSYEPSKLLAALKLCKPPEPPKSRISSGSASVSGRVGGVAPVSSALTRGATSSLDRKSGSAGIDRKSGSEECRSEIGRAVQQECRDRSPDLRSEERFSRNAETDLQI
ncbi:hypothetical protein PVT01_000070800 [Plasmodium vivax]|uniref:VIR protein n=1 Tax=Plasmodium vivax TaxID=5855 RepID=A0A1G4E370_PLAVI|nr:hypothetical protein PVT01_000070800 [Plasmodium vivax]